MTVQVGDLKKYLEQFPDGAVVVRSSEDAPASDPYVDLDQAMAELEDEEQDVDDVDTDDDDDDVDDVYDPQADDEEYDRQVQDQRNETREAERAIDRMERDRD